MVFSSLILKCFSIAAPLYGIAQPDCASGQCNDQKRSLLQIVKLTDHVQYVDQETRDDAVDTESLSEMENASTVETHAKKSQLGGTEFPFVWLPCQPCEIRYPEHGGAKDLEIDIWNYHLKYIKTPRPVVFAMHGNGGNVKTMKPHCTKVFNVAGYLCVSISPRGNKNQPSIFVEGAILYMWKNCATYNVDKDNFFLYGYSGGSHTMLRYMMHTTKYFYRDRILGMISDCGAPGDSEFNWQTMVDGEYLAFPPYLMMHCTEDKTMKPEWSVKKSRDNINKANKKRSSDNQILYKWEKWTKESECGHSSLILDYEIGADSAVAFIENIMAGNDPFLGISDTVPEETFSTGCTDVQPPSSWKYNTCDLQLVETDNCAERRAGTRTDGYCSKTCGVCTDVLPTITTSTMEFTFTTPASTSCTDVPPPSFWKYNTCEQQLVETDNCAERRDGTRDDGYCSKTCGVC